MSDDDDTSTSMAAPHEVVPRTRFKVAPTDGTTKFNTIRIPLIPVACWRLNDPAFGFDSSFVAPTFRDEIGTLSGIVAANPECPATLFGHCDPAGSDAVNKTIGDRRAIAIYALVTRQPDLWEDLYSHPQDGDTWGMRAIQTMLASLVDGGGTPYYLGAIDGVAGTGTSDALKQFQGDNAELTASGRADAATRKKLFAAYMDWLCTSGPTPSPENDASEGPSSAPPAATPTPFQMAATDFLGGAAAQPGDLPKMSLQSCGKFNPIVLLTAAEMQGYDEKNRNADDAPNRRVIMFFFAKGTTVDTSVWPCPKVKEAGDACKGAFWPDGDAKRKNGAAQRLYKYTRDTMACRFYDRFARRSPCEGAPRRVPVTTPVVWTTSHQPYGSALGSMRLDFLSDAETVARSIPGAAAVQLDAAFAFEVDPNDVDAAQFIRLASADGTPLEHSVPTSTIRPPRGAAANPSRQTSTTFAVAIELVARFADGTVTTECTFDVAVDGQSAGSFGPGTSSVTVSQGSTVTIHAHATSPDHWDLDDAVLELTVTGSATFDVGGRHPDFKPPAWTNATQPARIVCEYYLSRLKDFTGEALLTIHTGNPKKLDFKLDFIPENEDDRPVLRIPTPTFGQFEIADGALQRLPADYAGADARVVEIKQSKGPVLGRNPRTVGVTWVTTDPGDANKTFALGGMDVLTVLSIPHGHREFFDGNDDHQHSFDWMWLYPWWWMNYFVFPKEDPVAANPPATPNPYPPAGTEQDPFSFLAGPGKRRFRSGAGVAHQLAATKRPIMALFPLPGLDIAGNETSVNEWKDGDAMSEFLYELVTMIRRQHGDYRPLERGKHLGKLGLCGHSRACTDAVMPFARAWIEPGSPLAEKLVDVILLDPPEGSTNKLFADASAWLARRKALGQPVDRVRTCLETKSFPYVSAFGGPPPTGSTGACSEASSTGTRVYGGPISFVFVPLDEWRKARKAALGATAVFSGDDAHMCAAFYGVFMALKGSSLGT